MAAPDTDNSLPTSGLTVPHGALALAGALSVLGAALELVVHESVHVAINAVATGHVPDCGTVGPFINYYGRLGVCYEPGGVPVLNDFLTPLVMSALGLVALHESPRFRHYSLRRAAFAVGVYTWFLEALYSMGYYVPPTVTAAGVEYHSDGAVALAAFGHPAQLPGVVLLALGLVALSRRVEYRA